MRRLITILILLALLGALAWGIALRMAELKEADAAPERGRGVVPVEVGNVERGPLTLRRTFSGALEAAAEFVAAPKVGGRLARLEVDLGDMVTRDQVVAYLDDDEFVQAVHLAEADLAVAEASHKEAESAIEIAERGLRRSKSLLEQGVSSESELDAAMSEAVASRAHVQVTKANIARAQATLEAARIRLGYTRVKASWNGAGAQRIVAARHADPGGTVAANAPLLSIVELNPIVGVIHVPERDFARLVVGQLASLSTDAYPGRSFEARLSRIAPVFRESTRQARVELLIENKDESLKPGMFVRASIELERIEDAISVPFDALSDRGDETGVFVLDAAGEAVLWRTVQVGIREGERVEVSGEGLIGRVVTMGQELCDDGSRVALPADSSASPQVAR